MLSFHKSFSISDARISKLSDAFCSRDEHLKQINFKPGFSNHEIPELDRGTKQKIGKAILTING